MGDVRYHLIRPGSMWRTVYKCKISCGSSTRGKGGTGGQSFVLNLRGEEEEVGNDLPFGPWSPAIFVGYVIGMGML